MPTEKPKVYLDEEGNPLPAGATPPPVKPVYLSEDEPAAAPSKSAPPAPPGLLSSFLMGQGGKGGLADIPRAMVDTLGQIGTGIAELPGAVSDFVGNPGDPRASITGLPPEVEDSFPGGPIILGAGKTLFDASKAQFEDSRKKGRGLITSTLSATPLIGPAATVAGEEIGSGEPSRMASGVGSAIAQILPFGLGRGLLKGASKLPVIGKIAPAIEQMAATSTAKSYARSLVPPTKKLALAAREVAPTVAGAGAEAMTMPKYLRWLTAKTYQAGKAVDAVLQFHGEAPLDKPVILDRLKSAMNVHINPRTGTYMTPEGANAIATVGKIVEEADKNLGPAPTVTDLVRYKRALDAMVTKGKSAPFSDLAKTGSLSYYKDAANILRDALNAVHPDIATANKNFSDFMKAKGILNEADKAAKAGEITKPGTLGGIGMHTTAPGALVKAWQALSLKRSPWWNTLVGAQKQKITSMLKTGDFSGLEDILVVAQLSKPPTKKPTYFPDLAEASAPEPPPSLELGVP